MRSFIITRNTLLYNVVFIIVNTAVAIAVAIILAELELDKETIVAGLLHDVLEDTKCTEEYLRSRGIPDDVIDGIKSVTRNDDESYGDFVKRAAQNPFGKIVKLHDLMDNLDVKRLNHLTTEDLNRINKYLKWYNYLKKS